VDNTQEYTCLSLCSGYGGLELGIKRACPALRTIAYVEIEAFAVANLVSKMEQGFLDAAPIWTDIKSFDAEPFCDKVHFITAGFPCQPFSYAGQRKGGTDPRHLWPHIERIIETIKPVWVALENVPGILSARTLDNRPDLRQYLTQMAQATKKMPAKQKWYLRAHLRRLEQYWLRTEGVPTYPYIYYQLQNMGYKVEAGLFTAAEVGAPHRRERLFILAYNTRERLSQPRFEWKWKFRKKKRKRVDRRFEQCSSELDKPETAERRRMSEKHAGRGIEKTGRPYRGWPARPGQPQYEWEEPRVVGNAGKRRHKQSPEELQTGRNTSQQAGKGQAQSRLGRTVDGTYYRVDRLRLLGNGVVPQQAEKAFRYMTNRFEVKLTVEPK